MPLPSLISAIVSSIVGSAADAAVTQITTPPDPVPAVTSLRLLPEGAAKGKLVITGFLTGEIDGNAVLLSPGVQIRNEFNVIVQPASLEEPTVVRYLTDAGGSVYRVWILSAQEAADSQ